MQADPHDHQENAQEIGWSGICLSTTAPVTAAMAGSRLSMSAKLARGSRAIAS